MQSIDYELIDVTRGDYERWCEVHGLEPAPEDSICYDTDYCWNCEEFACDKNFITLTMGDQIVAKYQFQTDGNALLNVWRIYVKGFKSKESNKKENIYHEPESVVRDVFQNRERFFGIRFDDPVIFREPGKKDRKLSIEHVVSQEDSDKRRADWAKPCRSVIDETAGLHSPTMKEVQETIKNFRK